MELHNEVQICVLDVIWSGCYKRDMIPELHQTPVPTRDEAATAIENARLKAAVGYEMMLELLTIQGFDPKISVSNRLSITEHLYKASGMAAKQEAPKNAGFSISIVLPGSKEKLVVGSGGPENDMLPAAPVYMSTMPQLGNPITIDVDGQEID